MKSTIQNLDLRMSKSIYDSFNSNKILSKFTKKFTLFTSISHC